MTDLEKLRQQHDTYVAKRRARGDRLLAYTTPCCGGDLETLAAGPGERWDTLATCPHCGALYMKITNHSSIEAVLPEGDSTP